MEGLERKEFYSSARGRFPVTGRLEVGDTPLHSAQRLDTV